MTYYVALLPFDRRDSIQGKILYPSVEELKNHEKHYWAIGVVKTNGDLPIYKII